MDQFHNYKFYINEKKRQVIAISTYAGKTVKGVATCNKEDDFDIEKGKKLAAARCNLKVAKKRRARALQKYAETRTRFLKMKEERAHALHYRIDASNAFRDAEYALNKILLEEM